MREVEVKIKIADCGQVIDKLQSLGYVFGEPIVQQDIVYIPNEIATVPTPPGTNVLRIRKQKDKILFTLKRSDAGNHLSKLEHELEIGDAVQMDAVIKLLGFKIVADTTKTRRKCKIKDYEICVDHVNELGDYLEIEKMTDEDPHQAQEEMLKILQDLGIDVSQRVDVGYDVLFVRKFK